MKKCPKIGKMFRLRLDGENLKFEPMALVRARTDDADDWRHRGDVIKHPAIGYFKLIQVGHCANWQELLTKLRAKGKIPEGQWLEALRSNCPGEQLGGLIAVADASWYAPGGANYFPAINAEGKPIFYWPRSDFEAGWRWLVQVG